MLFLAAVALFGFHATAIGALLFSTHCRSGPHLPCRRTWHWNAIWAEGT